MITDLETLLNDDQFKELVKAINENKEYTYEKDGLKINAKSSDNSLQLSIAYDEDKKESSLAKQEVAKFQKFLNALDDDLFIEVCDFISQKNLEKIQECLNSDKLETVRAAILNFRSALNKIVDNKISYLSSLIYA